MKYLPYILILAAFCILFVRARGLFSAVARYLHVRSEALARYISEETLKRMLLILFAANLLGAFMTWRDAESDTAAKGYLVRNEYGSNGAEAELTVTLDGEKQDVELPVAARVHGGAGGPHPYPVRAGLAQRRRHSGSGSVESQ